MLALESSRSTFRRASQYICPSCTRKLSTFSSVLQQSLSLRSSLQLKSRPWLQQRRWVGMNYIKKMVNAEDDFSKRAEDIRNGRKRSVLEVLEERGFVNQIVGTREQLKTLFDNRRVGAYVGVDPTASSMHVGHMVPFMALSWLYVHGYSVHFLLGGSTAGIGDPEGRLSAREKVGRKERRANIASMHMQLKRFGETMEKYANNRGYQKEWAWRRSLVNNSAWQNSTPVSEWIRLMASGIRLGPMLGRDSVKNRLEKGDGMSFAEFCYPLVQAWDWWELFQKGVQVQIGGADQFGNILQGAEAVKYAASADTPHQERLSQERKIEQLDPKTNLPLTWSHRDKSASGATEVTEDPLGFTVPLLTTAAGEKFGKSAGNAIWLDPDLTSPFDLYQFFLRSADADVEKYLKLFTFIPLPDITSLMTEHNTDASKRIAQHKLASEFVELIHGRVVAETAEKQHRALFNKKITISELQEQSKDNYYRPLERKMNSNTIDPPDSHPSLNKSAPPQDMHTHASNTCTLPAGLVYQQPLSKILWSAGLVATKSEGNRLILNGGVYIGGKAGAQAQMGDELSYTPADTKKARWEELEKYIIRGEGEDDLLILRTGKWRVKIIRVVSDGEFRERGLVAPGWEELGMDSGFEAGAHFGRAGMERGGGGGERWRESMKAKGMAGKGGQRPWEGRGAVGSKAEGNYGQRNDQNGGDML